MLYVEKIVGERTVKVVVKNRLFYIVAISGISHEETSRLADELYKSLEKEDSYNIGNVVHHIWWENQKVAVIFVTGDIYDEDLYEGKLDVEEVKAAVEEFDSEIKIPHLSIKPGDEVKGIPAVSMIGMIAKDEEGEFSVFTSNEEIFTGCMRQC